MCELLGMSANVPTDICFSFTGLVQRGGGTGPHKDGWGITFYEGKGGNDSNLLIVFYVQIMPDDLVMQLHRF